MRRPDPDPDGRLPPVKLVCCLGCLLLVPLRRSARQHVFFVGFPVEHVACFDPVLDEFVSADADHGGAGGEAGEPGEQLRAVDGPVDVAFVDGV